MKHQTLFSSNKKVKKKIKVSSAAILLGATGVKMNKKKADDKFTTPKLQRIFRSTCFILRIQRIEGKQCRSR